MDRAIYKATPPTLTDKQTHPLSLDASANLKVALADAAGGALTKTDDVALAPGCSFTPAGGIVDDAATDTADEGDGVVARYTARRAAAVNLDTLIAGEDQTNGVMKVEGQFSGTQCTSDTQVKASPGFLHALIIQPTDAVPTAGTIVVYDNTAESGTEVVRIDVKATASLGVEGVRSILVDRIMTVGIYVGFTTTADVAVQVIWR